MGRAAASGGKHWLVVAAAVVMSCSGLDAKVGPAQESCLPEGPGAGGSTSGGEYGSGAASTSSGGEEVSCATDTGSPCDDCEAAHCCTTRLECYGDALCHCADQALDTCLGEAPSDASATVASCWGAFSAVGPLEQERVSCQRAFCQTACEVP